MQNQMNETFGLSIVHHETETFCVGLAKLSFPKLQSII
jgi:hypothetical protein